MRMVERNFFNNFGDDLNVVLIGASGGIGRAFVDSLVIQDNVKNLYCFSRSGENFSGDTITNAKVDITDEGSVEDAANTLADIEIDIIIVATGILHGESLAPEKSLRDLDIENFRRVFDVNTFGPALVAKHFLPLIPKERKSVFATLSARVGSISDNHIGGWYAYRASKAALNMILRTTSIEVGRRFKQASIIGLHPGTVDTSLSEPFQSNVKEGKLFSPQFAAECLLKVINDATPEKSGKIFDWDNKEIPY